MTRIATKTGEPVLVPRRRRMTFVRKQRIWHLVGGLCRWCTEPVPMVGPEVIYDHFIPLALGGADEDENIRPLHVRPCNAVKTVWDQRRIAKARRIRKREAGETKAKRVIQSPGFRRDLKRKMSGQVERRDG